MSDLNQCKVPIFEGINTAVRVPTAEQAGNGSDLIKRHNDLIDRLSIRSYNILTTMLMG